MSLKIQPDLHYAKSDEWVRVEGNEAVIGISDYAQDALSDIVYVELPSAGDTFEAGKPFGVVECDDVVAQALGDLQPDGIAAAAVFWYASCAVYAVVWVAVYIMK